MLDFIDNELEEIRRAGLYRSLKCVDGQQGARVTVDGRASLNLCSNNYLGLANDPRLMKASIAAIERYGVGTGASRLVCGNLRLHEQLEERLARFKHQKAALVFNSGYAANTGTIAALAGRDDIIFSDKLNHASIVDGIILSRAEFVRYPHRDMAALEKALQQTAASRKKIIITDTVFSMDGDTAPLPEIVSLAERFGAITMVDEAHATGVFGKGGRGLVNFCGLSDQVDVQMGTFSKAFGSLGGYICGKKKVIDYLVNRSRAFIYTTSLPPAILGACLEAVNVVESGDGLRSKLWENTRFMQKELTASGFDLMGSGSPIIPILVGDPEKAVEFSRLLLNEGIFLQAIRPPTVPAGQARLRLTVMATHARDELFGAVATIGKIGRKIGVINA